MSNRSQARKADLRACLTILRFLNLRHLVQHRRRTLLTLTGLAASVCLLITISVINSTLNSSIDAEARGFAGTATFEVRPAGAAPLGHATLTSLSHTPTLRAAVPFTRELSRVQGRTRVGRTLIYGVPRNLDALFPQGLGAVGAQLSSPAFLAGGLLLTQSFAQLIHVRAGDSVAVETAHGYEGVPVRAVLARGPFASVNGGQFALMSLPAAQRVFGRANTLDGVYVAARPGVPLSKLGRQLRQQLGANALVQAPGDGAEAYKRTFDSIASISQQARAIALLVALFLVLNTMSMSLAERREEIGLLSTGGALRGQIIAAFLVEAAILGLIGSVIGVLTGALLAHALVQHAVNSYNILPITASGSLVVRPLDVLLGVGGGTVITLIGAALPAARILSVAPIDALRPVAAYEWGTRGARRAPAFTLPLGVAAIVACALLAWLTPIGAHMVLVALALALAFVGAALLLPWLVPALTSLIRMLWPRMFGAIGRLAGDALLKAPGRTIIAAGGLAVAASLVLAVGSGIGSYQREAERAATVWYAAPLYVNAQGSAAYISDQPLSAVLALQLAQVPGVKAAYPMRFGLIDNHGYQLDVYALPVAQAAAAGDRVTGSLGISQAKLVKILGRHEVVISRLSARRHHLSIGQTLRIPTPAGRLPFRIGGVFNDIASFDSVFMEHSLYQSLSGDTNADRFAIVPQPGTNLGALKQRLQQFIQTSGVPATVLTRSQMRAYLVNAIQSLFSIAKGMEVASLLIAALIVLNTMLTATFERRREFGLQRVLGMSRRQLGGSVVLEAAAMSIVGALIAIVLGLGLGFLITLSIENQLAWRIGFHPSAGLIFGTAAATVAASVLAALYPSWLATRQRIVELLRFD